MRISVIVVTCDGSAYVEEQIESITAQTRTADEVLVFDDQSSDGTFEKVTSTLGRTGVARRNQTRQGVSANVEQALRCSTGDVVVLADQDDVWAPDKLLRIERHFMSDPGLSLFFSDADLIDENGRGLDSRLWDLVGFNERRRRHWSADPLDVVMSRTVVTGATCALSRSLLEHALPLPPSGLHDAWLALVAAFCGFGTLPSPEALISYRLHGQNNQGLPARTIWGRLGALRWPAPWVLEHWGTALERYPDAPGALRLKEAWSFHRARLLLPDGRSRLKAMAIDPLGIGYGTHVGGMRGLAWDLTAPRLFPERIQSDRSDLAAGD